MLYCTDSLPFEYRNPVFNAPSKRRQKPSEVWLNLMILRCATSTSFPGTFAISISIGGSFDAPVVDILPVYTAPLSVLTRNSLLLSRWATCDHCTATVPST